ncbi:uncharacterized protein LOC144368222 isoform X2 [Ictidomys tridecemlineatus]
MQPCNCFVYHTGLCMELQVEEDMNEVLMDSLKESSETGSGSIIYQNRTAYSPGLQNKASFYGTRIGPLKLQEDEDASFFLSRHIKDLLIQHDPEGHREELAEEHKLAEHFVRCPEALLTERCSKVPA